jgi:hypothetical protein
MRRTPVEKTGGDAIGGEELLFRGFASMRAKMPKLKATEFTAKQENVCLGEI